MRKGGTDPQETSKKMKEVLPVAASNFRCSFHQLLLRQLESEHAPKHFTDVEVSAISQETGELKADNSSRRFTMCFKHPRNGKFYFSLTSDGFSKLIYKSLGAVHDCYLLHSKTLVAKLTSFDSNVPPEVLYESDEEQIL